MGTAHHLHVSSPRAVPPRTLVPLVLGVRQVFSVELPPVSKLTTVTPSFEPQKQPRRVTETSSFRCGEKGCIFPALRGQGGKCIHHDRQEREPSMYLSKQPTWAALEQNRFVEPREEQVFGSREADRRRFDAERETFFES
jgi:hypothetical protein